MIKPSKAGERLGLLGLGLSETDIMSLYNDLGKTKDDGLRLLQVLGLYFIIDFRAQNHHREYLSELPIDFRSVLYQSRISLYTGAFTIYVNTLLRGHF